MEVSAETLRKKLSGRPQKLDYTDQVLMTLEYLRSVSALTTRSTILAKVDL